MLASRPHLLVKFQANETLSEKKRFRVNQDLPKEQVATLPGQVVQKVILGIFLALASGCENCTSQRTQDFLALHQAPPLGSCPA